ncbi:MAG: FAD-binding oxidoreductase [Devosia sp.]
MTLDSDVVIVGAGIIGLACAYRLSEAGRSVLLIDRKGMAEETSRGNAGAFAFSDIMPLATKDMWRKLPRWLADPLGPFTVRPQYLPQIMPWLLRFWRAGWPDRVDAAIKAQAAMMRLARTEMDAMVASAGLGGLVRSDGVLELYESESELRAAQGEINAKAREGIDIRVVRGEELGTLQPGLDRRFVAATFIPKWQTVTDPYDFAIALGHAAMTRGTTLRIADVTALRPLGSGVTLEFGDGTSLRAKSVVVAAGAWSRALVAPLGDLVPLDTERGYNTTLPPGAFDLQRQLVFPGHGFVVTPLSSGVRIGGAVELGGLELPPNFKRADAMLQKAAMFMPGLKTEGGKQWFGFRPSLPDSLPAIGRSRPSPHILYAFGHGHLGLTQSAATGRLIADLVAGTSPALDLTPFSPQRF